MIATPSQEALPTARGYKFGLRSRLLPRTELFATYWVLDLSSELVFVGDEGTTEARGRTHRDGVEVGARVRLLDWLTFTGDFTYTGHAEFTDTGLPIPLAPIWTARADLTARLPWGLSSSPEMRYVGDRIADDVGHHTARGYTLFNWTSRYRYRNVAAFFTVENLTNTDWREAQFFFTSRLGGEPARRRRRRPLHPRHAALVLRRIRSPLLDGIAHLSRDRRRHLLSDAATRSPTPESSAARLDRTGPWCALTGCPTSRAMEPVRRGTG